MAVLCTKIGKSWPAPPDLAALVVCWLGNKFQFKQIFNLFGCLPLAAAQPQISVFSSFSSSSFSSSFRRRLPKIFLFWYQHCLALAFLCNTLALHQPFICIASALHWHCIGARLILHWCCVDAALALHWGCIRATSTLHLCCIGTKLALHQHCIDSILALVLHCISFLQHFAISLSVKQHCRQRRTESIFSLVLPKGKVSNFWDKYSPLKSGKISERREYSKFSSVYYIH